MDAEGIIRELDERVEKLSGGVTPPEEGANTDVDTPTEVGYTEEEVVHGETEEQRQQRTNWKKRFINYKASTDVSLHELRSENLRLKESVASLMRRVETLSNNFAQVKTEADPFNGVFTQDEADAFGEEGLSVIKKATQAVIEKTVNPLKEELTATKEERRRLAEQQVAQQKQQEYNKFLALLKRKAPNYEELNANANFLVWLNAIPEGEITPRINALRNAEAARDVVRVAEIFNEYDRQYGKGKATSSLNRHLTPESKGSTAVESTGRSGIDQTFINKFYDDYARGRYKGREKEAQEIEAKIDAHYERLMKQPRVARA